MPLPPMIDVDPAALTGDDVRGAFWTNLYNALVIDAVRREKVTGDLRTRRGFFRRNGIEVGGRRCSLHVIEHGLLRCNSPAPWTFWRALGAGDPRLPWALSRLDARVHFALNCGARSCPPVRTWNAARWNHQLDLATRAYFDSESRVGTDGSAELPWLMSLYGRDFPDPRAFASSHGPDAVREALASGAITRWRAYDWTIPPG